MVIKINDANGVRAAGIPSGAAVYVDTENLRDSDYARDIVARVVANWPDGYPPMGSLSLYVRADKAELWRLWAETEYPGLRVRVRGVQHFSANRAKNSADLAITADAVGDLMAGQAAAVAVVSNDSDFGALFVKVRELAGDGGVRDGFRDGGGGAPFLWITAPDAGLLSPEMEKFIPARYRWDLSDAGGNGAIPAGAVAPVVVAPTVSKPAPQPLREGGRAAAALPVAPAPAVSSPAAPAPAVSSPVAPAPAAATGNDNGTSPGSEAVAEELLRRLPVGRFKVADAQKVIQKRWPKLPIAGDTAKLGKYLLDEVWPLLQKRGVTMPRRYTPRTYDIPQAAKDAIMPPTTPTPPPDGKQTAAKPAATASEPTPEQLAAAVAAGIADDNDNFSASDAQAAIKARWSQHPAASQSAQKFGVWFKNDLWPVMEQHGAGIAREKPRRYEMTPDARHHIIALAPPGG